MNWIEQFESTRALGTRRVVKIEKLAAEISEVRKTLAIVLYL